MDREQNNLSITVDGKPYTVKKIHCLDGECNQFQYAVSDGVTECIVTASMDSDVCQSGCLDPELRQAACGALKEEIKKRIQEQ